VGAVRGYRCIFTLPETISKEKILAIKLFGAEVVLTPRGLPPSDERSCYKVAQKIAREKGGFYVNQYFNKLNPEAHYKTTGPEIWRYTEGKVDAVVCGIGTGGTITGIGRYLGEMKSSVKIIGVEPRDRYSDYLEKARSSRGGVQQRAWEELYSGRYRLQLHRRRDSGLRGRGAKMVEALVKKEGTAGDSSGAVMAGAIEYALARGGTSA
jgi:cystathionine beta-synthase